MSLKKIIVTGVLVSGLALVCSGCENLPEPHRGAGTGAAVGTLGGALVGAATGNWKGALIGAAVGGVGGAVVGNEYDKDKMYNKMGQLQSDMNTVIINIHNSNNSITPVYLRRVAPGQLQGPRGEIYQTTPTEEQLKQVYGF